MNTNDRSEEFIPFQSQSERLVRSRTDFQPACSVEILSLLLSRAVRCVRGSQTSTQKTQLDSPAERQHEENILQTAQSIQSAFTVVSRYFFIKFRHKILIQL